MNLNNILTNAPTNLQEIWDQSNWAIDEIKDSDGDISALEQSIKAKALIKSLESFLTQLELLTLSEAEKRGKSFELFGAKVVIAELGTKWHFDKCNDQELDQLDHNLKKSKSEVDARQKFLKNLDKPMDAVTEDGEVIKIYPAYKSSKTGIKVTFGTDE